MNAARGPVRCLFGAAQSFQMLLLLSQWYGQQQGEVSQQKYLGFLCPRLSEGGGSNSRRPP